MILEPQPVPALGDLGRVHFIAIGGAGMSGVARGFVARGLPVTGSDQADSEALRALQALGVTCWVGHDARHVAGADTVVVSTAIRGDNVELVEARRRGLRVLHRSVALACLMEGYEVIAVAGTHGKTTTTAMCVAGLMGAGEDPSYVVGGTVLATGEGAHIGTGRFFVVEADESDGSFRQYPARIAVITNVEADHLDNWGTATHYAAGFAEFATGPGVELVILDADNPGTARLAATLARRGRRVSTYGESATAGLRLTDLHPAAHAGELRGRDWSATLQIEAPGIHNLHNAAAALAVGEALGVDRAGFLAGLATFHGTARRFQHLGVAGGVTVVDDYAHHPTEVAATLAAARLAAGGNRVVVCFQPHLFSRTRDFADEFGRALAAADEVVVLDVYPAREDPIPGVTGELVAEAAARHGGRVHYVPEFGAAVDGLLSLVRPGDLVLTVGAGSVTTLGPALLARLGVR
ncbi:MAG: UDP-N-acetylmuramate--L-alanine ligase [Propionibacteriaceae bacterium]|jgi:UDP-N-acetylmuramate--alanine ligase|nr:UDP-N-acetylmuramate--L-alanine ligase [Propionibacteriaceae bacterium]